MAAPWNYLFVLIWFSFLISSGIHLFSKGFLLTRVSQSDVNKCNGFLDTIGCSNSSSDNCEIIAETILKDVNTSCDICLPMKSKVILVVVDALKYDFGVYNTENTNPLPYENKLPKLHQLLTAEPEKSRLLRFVADPPTTTMQRLKGITTGSLPTFIDIGSNFATAEINEDNIIDQMIRNNLTTVFMGDSTWVELFPKRFKRQYPFPSFNIYDLDTIDKNIENILPKELEKSDWDVLIAHFLGVDHCGHKYGPNHPEMSRKLTEMNDVITSIINKMDDNTTLIVIGDHGMTSTGDHGGESDEEINALLFMYSKNRPLISNDFSFNDYVMQQIDIVPTLSAILGIPIPYSNLGTVQLNLLPDISIEGFLRYQILLLHAWQNAKQMHNYFHTYAMANENTFKNDYLDEFNHKFNVLSHRANLIFTEAAFKNFAKDMQSHLSEILQTCREIWVKFDGNLMSEGLLIVVLTTFLFYILINNFKVTQFPIIFHTDNIIFIYVSNFGITGLCYAIKKIFRIDLDFNTILFYTCIYSVLLICFFILQNWCLIVDNMTEQKQSNIITRLIFILFVCIFFSNSFIIQEQKILNYLIGGLILIGLYEIISNFDINIDIKKQQLNKHIRIFKSTIFKIIILSLFSIILLRITYVLFKCREEQTDCKYLFDNNNNNRKSKEITIRDFLPIIIMAIYTSITKIFFRSIGNLTGHSINVIYFRYGPTIGTICTAGHFILSKNLFIGIRPIHIDALAWIVYLLFIIQIIILFINPLLIHLIPNQSNYLNIYGTNVVPEIFKHIKSGYNNIRKDNENNIPIVCGLATVYSSVYFGFGFVMAIQLGLLLGLFPSAGIFLSIGIGLIILIMGGILRFQSTKNFEICVQPRFITLISWLILAHYTFYATSHQSTMSQIEWRSAFIGRTTKYDNNLIISAVLVLMNTFNGIILFLCIYPLLNIIPFVITTVMPSLEKKLNKKDAEKLKAMTGNNTVEYRTVNINKNENENTEENFDFDISKGELNLYLKDKLFIGSVFKTGCQLLLLQSVRIFCSMLACTIHCRHLMVWKIFAPRFIFEGITTYISIIAILFGYILLIRIQKAIEYFIMKIQKSQ